MRAPLRGRLELRHPPVSRHIVTSEFGNQGTHSFVMPANAVNDLHVFRIGDVIPGVFQAILAGQPRSCNTPLHEGRRDRVLRAVLDYERRRR